MWLDRLGYAPPLEYDKYSACEGFLVTVEEAYKIIQQNLPTFGQTVANLGKGLDARTCENLVADRDYPPFHRVTMDGIAISSATLLSGASTFAIEGICAAGSPAKGLQNPLSCLEVMTGAPLPIGCDLVIPYEEVSIENGDAKVIEAKSRKQFDNVHLMGSDFKGGDVLLKSGEKLNGPHWGIAASIGKTEVQVKRKPKINIISTGDELINVSETPRDYQIRRSNVYALQASLQEHGFDQVTLSHLNDDEDAIEHHYQENAKHFDWMIYSGGVSKGKYDFLPTTWKNLGVRELVHGVSQRPGKPLWFGIDDSIKTAVFGLPGNPVSSLVCLHRYLLDRKPIYAQLAADFSFDKNLTYFLPVKLEHTREGVLRAHPLKIKNSGEFSALAGSDGFIELPKSQSQFQAGEAFQYFPWSTV